MDPTADIADQPEARPAATLLGPGARAFGKGVLIAYWIVCLSVIALGLSSMEWRWRQEGARPAAAAPVRPADTHQAAAPRATPKPAASEATVYSAPMAGAALSPAAWLSGVLVVLSMGGLVWLLLRTARRRGSRQLGRFSGRRRRVGSPSRGPLWLD